MIITFYDHLYIGLKSCGWPGAAIVGNQGCVTVIVSFVCLSLSLLLLLTFFRYFMIVTSV